jgi:hypothetical protein|nr:hypothetical protein [uncultured Lamprocystis sp.]
MKEAHQAGRGVDPQRHHDPGAVGLHRLGADARSFGDLFGTPTLGHEPQHLALTLGQQRLVQIRAALHRGRAHLASSRNRPKAPRYPSIPAVRLGRLAVDQACRGQGLGSA